jgi:hypothetical protein
VTQNNSKFQAPTSRQAPTIKLKFLPAIWEFDVWNFSGAWMLALGVSIHAH